MAPSSSSVVTPSSQLIMAPSSPSAVAPSSQPGFQSVSLETTTLVKEVLCAKNTVRTYGGKKKFAASSSKSASTSPPKMRKSDRRPNKKSKSKVWNKERGPMSSETVQISNAETIIYLLNYYSLYIFYFSRKESKHGCNVNHLVKCGFIFGWWNIFKIFGSISNIFFLFYFSGV